MADKVYRSFRAGRPFKKDRLLRPPMALAEVCEMRDRLREAMRQATPPLDPNDCQTAIVFQIALDEPPQVRVVPIGKETDVLDAMMGKYQAVTVGALFALRDKQRGGTIRRWAHPFLIGAEALKMLNAALDSQEMQGALN